MKFSFKPKALAVLVMGALYAPVAVFADAGGVFDDPVKTKASSNKAAAAPKAKSNVNAKATTSNAKVDPDARAKADIAALNARLDRLAQAGNMPGISLPGSIQVQRGSPFTDNFLDDGRASGSELRLLGLKANKHLEGSTVYVGANLRASTYYQDDADGPNPDARNSAFTSAVSLDRTALGFLANMNNSTSAFVVINGSSVENAYVLWGDLNASPYYLLMGKNDVNFGNFRRLTPSTDPLVKTWFDAGQRNLVSLGYAEDGLELSASFFNGDAKPETVTPASTRDIRPAPNTIGNYALSSSYQFNVMDTADIKLGLGLLSSSGFSKDNGGVNPALDAYADLLMGRLLVHSEYVRTLHSSASTLRMTTLNGALTTVADPSTTETARGIVNAWNLGASYVFPVYQHDTKASFSFGQFQPNRTARADQTVLGYSVKLAEGLETGIEYAHQTVYGAVGTEIYTSNKIAAVFSAYF